jgi:hypothetical protein
MSAVGSWQVEGKCLDLQNGNTTNGTPVQIWDCVGGQHQQWMSGSDGTIRYAANQNKCLDLTAGNTADGTKLQIWDCAGPTGGSHQHWSLGAGGALMGPDGKCVDDPYSNTQNGTVFDYWDCNGGHNQQFTFMTVPGALTVNGVCADLQNGNTTNGTPVQVWQCVAGTHQQWALGSDATIRYAANPSKCLDLTGGVEAPGTKLQIWDCAGPTGGSHQHWSLAANGQLFAPGNLCVDDLNFNRNNGTVLDVQGCDLGSEQTFSFSPQ